MSLHERFKYDQTWLTKSDLVHIKNMMAVDMSEKIDWDYQLAEHKDTNIDALNKGNINELKNIAAQKVNLAPPIRKPAQITFEDGAFQLTLSYSELKKLLENATIDEDYLTDYKTVLSKLALIAFAYPELSKSLFGSSYGPKPKTPIPTKNESAGAEATKNVLDPMIIDSQISNLENEIVMKKKQLKDWKEMAKKYDDKE